MDKKCSFMEHTKQPEFYILDYDMVKKHTEEDPPEILAESGIGILEFKEKFCADGNCFVIQAKDEIEHIFCVRFSGCLGNSTR